MVNIQSFSYNSNWKPINCNLFLFIFHCRSSILRLLYWNIFLGLSGINSLHSKLVLKDNGNYRYENTESNLKKKFDWINKTSQTKSNLIFYDWVTMIAFCPYLVPFFCESKHIECWITHRISKFVNKTYMFTAKQ